VRLAERCSACRKAMTSLVHSAGRLFILSIYEARRTKCKQNVMPKTVNSGGLGCPDIRITRRPCVPMSGRPHNATSVSGCRDVQTSGHWRFQAQLRHAIAFP
jgi:hypothetical protein